VRKKIAVTVGLSLVLTLCAVRASLMAQEDLPGDRRERVMKRIEMMRMWKMTEDLNLTEREGSVLFPFLRGLEEERRGLDKERGRAMRELRATMRGENPDYVVINELLERIERARAELRRLDDREFEKVRDLLNPEQVARYIIFKQDFDRDIRDVIFRARRRDPAVDIPERRTPVPEEDRFPPK